jgi:superfamily II DNA or RNA helicase/HKD family nuclease
MSNLLMDPLLNLAKRGGQIFLLTSVMNGFNNPDDLCHLQRMIPDLKLKIFLPGGVRPALHWRNIPPFHVKCYLFEKKDNRHALVVGSSNLTKGGLCQNHEWNYYSNCEVNIPFDTTTIFQQAQATFGTYWQAESSVELSQTFLDWYRPRWNSDSPVSRKKVSTAELRADAPPTSEEVVSPILPRFTQIEVLRKLAECRNLHGWQKAAIIAATGIGKTYLAAFDFQQSGLKNILFVVHRENILATALDRFRKILANPRWGILLDGNSSEIDWTTAKQTGQSVFAMIQTLARAKNLTQFPPDAFEYVVIDEFHHSEADSYRQVIEYFRPKFLLGLTATPERMDGRDVLRHCDYHIAYEIRLLEAIDQGYLIPFHYFAVYDPIDYRQIRWTGQGYDEKELEQSLSDDMRANLIIQNLRRLLPAFGKIKALAFCSSKVHARYMDKKFQDAGLPSACLLGEDLPERRSEVIKQLQNEDDPLAIICSVDVLGEGIDIPEVSHILLLRPTQSFSLFLQQIGRGLRPASGKDFVVIIDFVGNFHNSYVPRLAMAGFSSLDAYRQQTPRDIASLNRRIPTGCYVSINHEVQEIQEQEIAKLLNPRHKSNRREELVQNYHEIRQNLDQSPCLMDFFGNPAAADPKIFIDYFQGWLKTKEQMDDLRPFERQLLGTSGERFLLHLEKELSPTKSYKMVVIHILLQMPIMDNGCWPITEIARHFLRYYLEHPEQRWDYDALARELEPDLFPLKRVIAHLLKNPLSYLSNKSEDFFILDRNEKRFYLKAEILAFWHNLEYRELVQDRVDYGLKRYFYRAKSPTYRAALPIEIIET